MALAQPLCGFFALTFAICWGGILVVLSAAGFELVELRPLDTGLFFVFMLLGPSTSGLALTALLEGRAGLRRLVARMAHRRLGPVWAIWHVLVDYRQNSAAMGAPWLCNKTGQSVFAAARLHAT